MNPKKLVPLLSLLTLSLASSPLAKNCAVTSTGRVPLPDLGPGLYQGFEGGFYAGGANARPAAHESAGVAIANAIVPLDASGAPDPANGSIVLLSIGMSNTTQEYSRFVELANADPEKNPRVLLVDGAQGGQDARTISNPAAAFWANVDSRLAARGATPAQVQAVWVKEAVAGPTLPFPPHAEQLEDFLADIVRILHDRYPNAKQTFLSSRTYAGYADTSLNPEPFAYESGFSVKWLVDAQISGDPSLEFDAARGPVEAPWLSWGPYLWTDGLAGRSDGLVWSCDDVQNDGTHPADGGRQKVAELLLDFFKSDTAAAPWFRSGGTLPVVPGEVEPNDVPAQATPTADGFTISGQASPGDVDLFAFDAEAGETVRVRARTPLSLLDAAVAVLSPDGLATLASDSDDDDGTDALACATIPASGRYLVRVTGEGAATTGRYALLLEKATPDGAEAEPNDLRPQATAIVSGDILSGALDPAADTDQFRFTAASGTGVDVAFFSCGGPAPAGRDAQMRIVNSSGAILLGDDNSGPDSDPRIQSVLPATVDGVYFAVVRPAANTGAPEFLYSIRLELADLVFDATPVEGGPRYAPGTRPRLHLAARNVTPAPKAGLTFTIVAEPIPGGPPVEILRKRREGGVPANWTKAATIRLRNLPATPGRYRLVATLATDDGLAAVRRLEVERE